ncbi:hypothetical protein F4860DRAFT_510848 [Xylaria cubensis]|nr:hypothetical protein F4860DRAFT_510848 [Xylaria cubensis]
MSTPSREGMDNKASAPESQPVEKNKGGRPSHVELARRMETWKIRQSSRLKDMAEPFRRNEASTILLDTDEAVFIEETSAQSNKSKGPRTRPRRTGQPKRQKPPAWEGFIHLNAEEFEKQLQDWTEDQAENLQSVVDAQSMSTLEVDRDRVPDPYNSDIGMRALNEDWQHLWKWCLALFQSCPYDLFTWGLRLTSKVSEHADIYRGICMLLPHPAWQRQLSQLRYALQMAVYIRSETHMMPVGPLPAEATAGLLNNHRVNNGELVATLALDSWNHARDDKDGMMYILTEEMKSLRDSASTVSFPHHQYGNRLFYLSTYDVAAVTSALDSLQDRGRFSHRVLTYYRKCVCQTGSQFDRLPPKDSETLQRWDGVCVHNRHRDGLRGLSDIPYAERAIYEKIGYWQSSDCDIQVTQALFDDYQRICESISPTKKAPSQASEGPADVDFPAPESPTNPDSPATTRFIEVTKFQQLLTRPSHQHTATRPTVSLICLDGFYLPQEPGDTSPPRLVTTCVPAMTFTLFRSMLATGFIPKTESGPLIDLIQGSFGEDLERDRGAALALFRHLMPVNTNTDAKYTSEHLRFEALLLQPDVWLSFPIPCLRIRRGAAKFENQTPQRTAVVDCEEFPDSETRFVETPSHCRIFFRGDTQTFHRTLNEIRHIKGVLPLSGGADVLYNLLALVEFPATIADPERFWLFDQHGNHVTSSSVPESLLQSFPSEPLPNLSRRKGRGCSYMLVYNRIQPPPDACEGDIEDMDLGDFLECQGLEHVPSPQNQSAGSVANSNVTDKSSSISVVGSKRGNDAQSPTRFRQQKKRISSGLEPTMRLSDCYDIP